MSILNPKKIQIRRSMEYRYSAKEWRIGEPKSKSGYRTIPLTEEAVAILKNKKKRIRGFQKFQQNGKNLCFCVEKGHQPRTVHRTLQMLLSHSNIGITMNLYVHTAEEEKKKEIKGFTGGNIKNEIRNRRFTQCREKYII